MKYLMMTVALVAGCSEPETKDSPEVTAAKAECHQLFVHVAQISPQAAGRDPEQVVAEFPVEATEECRVAEHEVRACMIAAKDVAGVRACVPSDEVLACMGKAVNVPSVRAKCWSGAATDKGNPKAADGLSEATLACAARAGAKHVEIAERCVADPHAADGIKVEEK